MPEHYQKNYIVLHHTATDRDRTTFDAVNNYHKEQWNFKSSLGYYIGYHYFITADGHVYQGRADWETGAHCYQQNKNYDSIGISLTGNFDQQDPSQAQLDSLRELVKRLMAEHGIPKENLKFHRDYAPKTCPGTRIKADFFTVLLSSDDTMKLVQKIGQSDIYAVDKFNRRHLILNWDTFRRGLAMGMWTDQIEKLSSLDQYPSGNVVILADNS